MAAKKKKAKKVTKKKTAKKVAKKVTKKKTTKKKAKAKTKAKATKKAAKVAKVPVKAVPTPPKKAVLVNPKNTSTLQYTQGELMDCIQASCGFASRKEAKEFYGMFSGLIQSALKRGYRLALPGLGKLQVRKSKARTGINPMTREPIKIPARKRVRFTPNKALKDAVL